MNLESGFPCSLCQVRPDVACRHRPADPSWTPPPPMAPARAGQGSGGGGGNGWNLQRGWKMHEQRLREGKGRD